MQHNIETSARAASSRTDTVVGLIGNWPARLVTAAEYWEGAGEPLDLLDSPGDEFERAATELRAICTANGIAYRPASPNKPAVFPAWLFLRVYPANP